MERDLIFLSVAAQVMLTLLLFIRLAGLRAQGDQQHREPAPNPGPVLCPEVFSIWVLMLKLMTLLNLRTPLGL